MHDGTNADMAVLDLVQMRQRIIDTAYEVGFDGWVELAEPHVVRENGTATFDVASVWHRCAEKPSRRSFTRKSDFVRIGPWARA